MNPRTGWFSRLASFLFVGLIGGLPAVAQQTHTIPKRIVGDYGYWSKSANPPFGAAQIPYGELTHINHAGVSFDGGRERSRCQRDFMEPELNSKAHAAGVKVMLLLGGDFAGLETSGALNTLVETCGRVCHGVWLRRLRH